MSVGIKLDNCTGVKITGSHLQGMDVGIQSRNSTFSADSTTFRNVRQPFDVQGGSISTSGTRISDDPKIRESVKGKSFVGYTGRNGPPIPAQCPRCGSIFPSRNYDIGKSLFYSRDDEETCPVCRFEHAKVADGLFDLTKGIVELIQGPDLTKQQLATLNQLSLEFLRGERTTRQYIRNVQSESKPLAAFLAKAIRFKDTGIALLALVVAIASYMQDQAQNSQNPNARVEKLLEQVLQKIDERRFESKPAKQAEEYDRKHQAGTAPSGSKPADETGSIASLKPSKPKARDIRRKHLHDRRSAFNPRKKKCEEP